MEWSKQEIQRANELDIVEVAQRLGLDVVAKGRFLRTRCLWHNDDTPSLQLGGREAYRSRCKCYSCGAMHGVVDLVMEAASKTFPEAMEWIFESFGLVKEEGLRGKDEGLRAKFFSRARHPELTEQREQCHARMNNAESRGKKTEGQQRRKPASKDPTPTQRLSPAELAGDSSTSLCSAQNDGSEGNAREKPLEYCGIEEVRRRVSPGNALCLCLKDYFPSDVVDQVTMMYQLGTDYAVDSRCHTLFPSIDRQGRVHDVKLQVYDINRQSPRYGHSQATYWVGKRLLLREDGTEYDRDTECLFGEHLLALRPSATVGLVESPKNAIVCACQWPDQVWVATGNKGMLKRSVLAPLAGRQVLVYPDLDAAEEWGAILSGMQDLATFQMSDFVNTPRTEENKKMDIADLILMRNLSINNLFDDKDQDNAWHKEKCSCNYISHRVARECWGVEKNNGR